LVAPPAAFTRLKMFHSIFSQARHWRWWENRVAENPLSRAASCSLTGHNRDQSAIREQNWSVRQKKDLRRFRREAQMVFQDPFSSLNPRMTIAQTLIDPMRVHRLGGSAALRERAADLLAKVNLPGDYLERYPHAFSGGQRQRICIARALALDPRLIVADEAVASLDVTIQAQVINLLMDLQQDMGIAILFISHDMAVVERIAHRVAVMYLGEIVEIGDRRSVFGNPQHPYTRKLLSTVPVADPARRSIAREPLSDEIPSAVRPPHFVPVTLPMTAISPTHYVRATQPA